MAGPHSQLEIDTVEAQRELALATRDLVHIQRTARDEQVTANLISLYAVLQTEDPQHPRLPPLLAEITSRLNV